MGRLLFLLLCLIVFLLIILVVSKFIPLGGRKQMTHNEKRKSFDEDIQAVAKEIQKIKKDV